MDASTVRSCLAGEGFVVFVFEHFVLTAEALIGCGFVPETPAVNFAFALFCYAVGNTVRLTI